MLRLFTSTLRRTPKISFTSRALPKIDFMTIFQTQQRAWNSTVEQPKSTLAKKSEAISAPQEQSNILIVRGLPQAWGETEISSYFDREEGIVQKINLIKNRQGTNTGKALITFRTKELAETFFEKWDRNLVQADEFNKAITVQQFNLKKKEDTIEATQELKQVYIYNLSFKCGNDDIYKLSSDFGEVINVELPITANNKNKGFGYITFKEAKDAQKFLNFAHDRDFMGRKIKVQMAKSRYEGKSKRARSSFAFGVAQAEEEKLKGESLNENLRLYKSLLSRREIPSVENKITIQQAIVHVERGAEFEH